MRRGDEKGAEGAYLKMTEVAPDKVGPKMILGAFYASRKDWDLALQFMKKARELEPNNVEVTNAIAALYIDMGRPAESEKLIENVLRENPSDVGGRLLKTRLLIEKKKYKEAAALCQSIIEDQPRHSEAHYYRGVAYLRQNQITKAKVSLVKSVDYNPGNFRARLILAEIHVGEGAPDLALEQIESVLASEPENYHAQLARGNAYILKRDLKNALKAYERAAELNPAAAEAYYNLAALERLRGNHAQALKHLDKVLELKPDHMLAIQAKVSVYLNQKQPEGALSFINDALREHQQNAQLAGFLQQLKGKVLFAQRKYGVSEEAFREAITLNPDLMEPYLFLARIHLARNETSKAITQYEQILEKRPDFYQAYMAMGTIYYIEGKAAEARTMYEAALRINPNFAPAANNLAWMLLQKNEDLYRALDLAKKAKEQLPDDPNVSDTLGLALIRMGLYSSAVAELSEAVKKLPVNSTVLYHLALAHWKNGEKDKAIEILKKTLKADRKFQERKQAEKLLEEIQTEAS
jgi:tetratricopeptide (TPR) repeat protein